MKNAIAAVTLGAVFATLSGPAAAKGCMTGAAVGGAAGHVAGHHGLIGAAAGCAINHHRNTVKDRNAAAAAAQPGPRAGVAPVAPAAQPGPSHP